MAKAYTFEALQPEYEELLSNVEIRSTWKQAIDNQAKRILANKAKYQEVEDAIGVPWRFVGVVHSLECGLSFLGHLHNGDPLTARTRLEPRGYPKEGKPPFTWLVSAIDALKIKGLDKVKEWTDARVAYELERFNGFGYRGRINSPYLWSGSNHYTRGKYIRDHVYDSKAVSQQSGAILLYLRLRETESPVNVSITKEEKREVVKSSTKLTLGKRIRNWIVTVFGGGSAAASLGYGQQIKDLLSDYWVVLIILLVFGGWCLLKYWERRTLEDYKKGRYIPSKMEAKDELVE